MLGVNGVFRQVNPITSIVTDAMFTKLVLNKAQDRLWVFGFFTKAGSTTFNTKGLAVGATERIALFDVSDKNAPKFVTCPAPTVQSFDRTYTFTQGKTILLSGTFTAPNAGPRLVRLTCDGTAAWTDNVMNPAQVLPGVGSFKQAHGDESLFAFSTTGLFSNPIPTPLPATSYIRFGPDSTAWSTIATSNTVVQPTEPLHATLWAPTGAKEVYYIFDNPSGPATVTDNINKLGQYIHKNVENGARETQGSTAGRLSANLNINMPSSLTSVITDMVYDEVLKALVVMGSFRYFVAGAYVSAVPDTATGVIQQDKATYYAKPLTPGIAQLSGTGASATFAPVLGGAFANPSTFAAAGYYPTANNVCFRNVPTAYNVFAPYTAMFDEGANRWQPVPSLSLSLDGDLIFGGAPSISAIERIGGQFSPDAFFAGSFRTINGVTYNSIVKYTLNADGAATLTALGDATNIGLQAYGTNLGDPSSGTSPDDRHFVRYYGMAPGSVSMMTYDAGNKILYVAGNFIRAGPSNVVNLARWNENTKTWSDVDGGIAGSISKMIVSGGNLYVHGSFAYAGATHARNIAMFNTATQKWEALAEGVGSGATDMVEFQGSIFVHSSGAVSGQTLSTIQRWNMQSKTWTSLIPRRAQSAIDANTCLAPQCSVNMNAFYLLGNRLYLGDSSRNLYALSGDNYEIVHTANAGSGTPFYRNGLAAGTKVVLYNTGTITNLYTDKLDNAFFYNSDRESAFTDAPVTVWSSASKINVSMFLFALVAMVLAFFY